MGWVLGFLLVLALTKEGSCTFLLGLGLHELLNSPLLSFDEPRPPPPPPPPLPPSPPIYAFKAYRDPNPPIIPIKPGYKPKPYPDYMVSFASPGGGIGLGSSSMGGINIAGINLATMGVNFGGGSDSYSPPVYNPAASSMPYPAQNVPSPVSYSPANSYPPVGSNAPVSPYSPPTYNPNPAPAYGLSSSEVSALGYGVGSPSLKDLLSSMPQDGPADLLHPTQGSVGGDTPAGSGVGNIAIPSNSQFGHASVTSGIGVDGFSDGLVELKQQPAQDGKAIGGSSGGVGTPGQVSDVQIVTVSDSLPTAVFENTKEAPQADIPIFDSGDTEVRSNTEGRSNMRGHSNVAVLQPVMMKPPIADPLIAPALPEASPLQIGGGNNQLVFVPNRHISLRNRPQGSDAASDSDEQSPRSIFRPPQSLQGGKGPLYAPDLSNLNLENLNLGPFYTPTPEKEPAISDIGNDDTPPVRPSGGYERPEQTINLTDLPEEEVYKPITPVIDNDVPELPSREPGGLQEPPKERPRPKPEPAPEPEREEPADKEPEVFEMDEEDITTKPAKADVANDDTPERSPAAVPAADVPFVATAPLSGLGGLGGFSPFSGGFFPGGGFSSFPGMIGSAVSALRPGGGSFGGSVPTFAAPAADGGFSSFPASAGSFNPGFSSFGNAPGGFGPMFFQPGSMGGGQMFTVPVESFSRPVEELETAAVLLEPSNEVGMQQQQGPFGTGFSQQLTDEMQQQQFIQQQQNRPNFQDRPNFQQDRPNFQQQDAENFPQQFDGQQRPQDTPFERPVDFDRPQFENNNNFQRPPFDQFRTRPEENFPVDNGPFRGAENENFNQGQGSQPNENRPFGDFHQEEPRRPQFEERPTDNNNFRGNDGRFEEPVRPMFDDGRNAGQPDFSFNQPQFPQQNNDGGQEGFNFNSGDETSFHEEFPQKNFDGNRPNVATMFETNGNRFPPIVEFQTAPEQPANVEVSSVDATQGQITPKYDTVYESSQGLTPEPRPIYQPINEEISTPRFDDDQYASSTISYAVATPTPSDRSKPSYGGGETEESDTRSSYSADSRGPDYHPDEGPHGYAVANEAPSLEDGSYRPVGQSAPKISYNTGVESDGDYEYKPVMLIGPFGGGEERDDKKEQHNEEPGYGTRIRPVATGDSYSASQPIYNPPPAIDYGSSRQDSSNYDSYRPAVQPTLEYEDRLVTPEPHHARPAYPEEEPVTPYNEDSPIYNAVTPQMVLPPASDYKPVVLVGPFGTQRESNNPVAVHIHKERPGYPAESAASNYDSYYSQPQAQVRALKLEDPQQSGSNPIPDTAYIADTPPPGIPPFPVRTPMIRKRPTSFENSVPFLQDDHSDQPHSEPLSSPPVQDEMPTPDFPFSNPESNTIPPPTTQDGGLHYYPQFGIRSGPEHAEDSIANPQTNNNDEYSPLLMAGPFEGQQIPANPIPEKDNHAPPTESSPSSEYNPLILVGPFGNQHDNELSPNPEVTDPPASDNTPSVDVTRDDSVLHPVVMVGPFGANNEKDSSPSINNEYKPVFAAGPFDSGSVSVFDGDIPEQSTEPSDAYIATTQPLTETFDSISTSSDIDLRQISTTNIPNAWRTPSQRRRFFSSRRKMTGGLFPTTYHPTTPTPTPSDESMQTPSLPDNNELNPVDYNFVTSSSEHRVISEINEGQSSNDIVPLVTESTPHELSITPVEEATEQTKAAVEYTATEDDGARFGVRIHPKLTLKVTK